MWDLLLIMLIAVLFNHLGLADTVTYETERGLELFQMLDFLDVTRILPTGIAVGMYSGYCCFIYSILSGIMG